MNFFIAEFSRSYQKQAAVSVKNRRIQKEIKFKFIFIMSILCVCTAFISAITLQVLGFYGNLINFYCDLIKCHWFFLLRILLLNGIWDILCHLFQRVELNSAKWKTFLCKNDIENNNIKWFFYLFKSYSLQLISSGL